MWNDGWLWRDGFMDSYTLNDELDNGEAMGLNLIEIIDGKKHLNDLEKKNIKPDFIAKDFLEATNFILSNH